MMIKDFCVACQYRYLSKTLQTGWIEISLGNEAAQQTKSWRFRPTLHIFRRLPQSSPQHFILVWVRENHNVHL